MEILQNQLSHEHSLLRTLIDNLPDGIYVKDAEARKVMSNRADLEVLGCKSEAEATGKTDFDFFPREIAEKFFADDMTVLKTGTPVINREEKAVLPNGEIRWLLTTKAPWRTASGKIIGLIGIGRNITDQMKAEIKLKEERNLLRTVVDNLPDGIYAKDRQARKILANPADLKNMGCMTEAEAIGKTDADLFPAAIAEAFLADDLAVIQGGQAVINREEKVVRPDGETRWLLTSKIPWHNETGKIIGLVGIGRDITDKRNLEAEMQRSQRMESVARLATGIAHDLNNSLAPILVAIELLHAKLEDREGQHMLDTIESSAKRGAEIIKQVLLFSRGLEGRRMPVNLKHLAEGVARVAGQTLPKNIAIEMLVPDDTWLVGGDPLQLHQAMLNLCINAGEAMPQGGRMRIAAGNATLDAASAANHRGASQGRHVVLEVSDTGVGIPADIRDRIFEPFFSTKELGSKTVGMGLSTAVSIVKNLHGFITVDSELGKGSTFKVYLPAQPESEAEKSAGKPTA
jgi:PAS domain S-box-containing protein